MPSAADKKKNAANLLSSNPRSPAVLLHPFSRLLRAAAVAPCLLSVLEVSWVRLSWAAALNGNCRSPHCSREQNAQFYFHRAFIYFHRSLFGRHFPADTTQRELHAPDSRTQHAAIVWRITEITANGPSDTPMARRRLICLTAASTQYTASVFISRSWTWLCAAASDQ